MDERKPGWAGPRDVPVEWNRVTEAVLRCAFEVHSRLGPGLLERLYEEAICHEMTLAGLRFERQHRVPVAYRDITVGDVVLDLVVEGLVVLELKSIERVPDVHLAQLVCYLRSAGLPLGLLINFNVASLKHGIHRRVSTQSPLPTAFLSIPSAPRNSAHSAFTPVS